MSQLIIGTYYFPASSKALDAQLHVNGETVSLHADGKCIEVAQRSSVQITSVVPGVPLDLEFSNGGKFSAKHAHVRLENTSNRLALLEQNRKLIVASLVLMPILLWVIVMVVMPRAAQTVVAYLPDFVPQQMGQQAFKIIEKSFLEPSTTEQTKQQQVKQQWQQALAALNLPPKKYILHVYASEFFGPNAFALPDGTVVITDDLLAQLDDNPDAILAILLHEIGHVEQQHSLRMVAQSVSSAIIFSMIFGDIEGICEVLLGTASTLVQTNFSRDMEREADDYALSQLVVLGKSPQAFAQAMQSFLDLKTEHGSGQFLKYLSSHPDTQERIDKAKRF